MSDVFIELYLDEDMDVLIADMVRARGFAATTTRDAGRRGATDEQQLEFATSHQFAIVTHNRIDFERLIVKYFTSGKSHGGVIIAVRHDANELSRRLLLILNHFTADEMRDQLRYI